MAAVVLGFAPACVLSGDEQGWDDGEVEDSLAEADDEAGLMPFHVATFDHYPTEAEVEGALAELEAKGGVESTLNPTNPAWPAPGQKRVTIIATTANKKDAGTDDAKYVYVRAYWRAYGASSNYNEKLVLNAPNRDDLNRGAVNVFYYMMNLNQYAPGATQDKFMYAKIGNSSKDGWHCESIELSDLNNNGTSRNQSLPFNFWVDSPSVPESSLLNGNNTSWLSY